MSKKSKISPSICADHECSVTLVCRTRRQIRHIGAVRNTTIEQNDTTINNNYRTLAHTITSQEAKLTIMNVGQKYI